MTAPETPESFEDAVLSGLNREDGTTFPPKPARSGGWVFGAVCGILVGLTLFPAVRHTLISQLQFALLADRAPWLQALDSRRQEREARRLDIAAARLPDDYLLQVGRATVFADVGVREKARPEDAALPFNTDSDRTLLRLGILARDFPQAPGGYAHLARYMMSERVKIQRVELNAEGTQTRSQTPEPRNLRLIEWALLSGERLDPDNAFWSTMLATAYFAALKDDKAVAMLERASRKLRWDSYLYEEILGQWRLYSEAYGDKGAAQKLAPLSLVAFPHLQEIRQAARLLRHRAEAAAQQGQLVEAIRLRRNGARLAILLRDTASWAFEALYGTDLFFIAMTDSGAANVTNRIQRPIHWERQAKRYLELLRETKRIGEIRWVRSQVDDSCELRERIDLARYDASYPGLPPGIPLMPLFGNWMVGICLLQQIIALTVFALVARWLHNRAGQFGRAWQTFALVTPILLLGGSGLLLWTDQGSGLIAFVMILSVLVLGLRILNSLRRPLSKAEAIEDRWGHFTGVRFLVLLVGVAILAYFFSRNALSLLHPVAVILTGFVEYARNLTLQEAFLLSALAYGLPLAILILVTLWALYRRVALYPALLFGLRRLALPLITCLFVSYLLLLDRTLRLDAAATKAIHEAAQHDLHWILTHSGNAVETDAEP